MPLNTPNAQDSPTYAGQAVVDKTDLAAIANVAQSYGVVSGCLVSAGGAYNVNVASGVILVAGVQVPVSAVTALAPAAASSTDRRDIVVASTAGAVSIVSGTPTTETAIPWTTTSSYNPPVKPAIPAGSVLLAEIYIPGGGGTIVTGWITDKTLTNPYLTGVGAQTAIRTAANQDQPRRGGNIGVSTSVDASSSFTYGQIEAVLGDSIAAGTGTSAGNFGKNDWPSILANQENRLLGLPDAGIGYVDCTAGGGLYSMPQFSTVGASLTATTGLGPEVNNGQTAIQLTGTINSTTATNSLTDNRVFSRALIFYKPVANSDGIGVSLTGGGGTVTATIDANATSTPGNSTVSFYDTGLISSPAVAPVLSLTRVTKVTGAGGTAPIVYGVLYYSPGVAGTKGLVMFNCAASGTTTSDWLAQRNWESALSALGTSIRRVHVRLGINDSMASRQIGDGVCNNSTSLTSATAVFSRGDAGRVISGNANIPAGTTIATWISATQVTLSQATTGGSLTGQQVILGPIPISVTQTNLTTVVTRIRAALPLAEITLFGEYLPGAVVGNTAGVVTPDNYLANVVPVFQSVAYNNNCSYVDMFTRFGATQARVFTDCTISNGSPIVTSTAMAQFGPLDKGANFTGPNIPAGTTILSVQSTTQCTLSASATGSAPAAVNITAVSAAGGTVTSTTATQGFTTGEKILFTGLSGGFGVLNGTTQTVLASGLTTTSFGVTSAATGSTTTGTAAPAYTIASDVYGLTMDAGVHFGDSTNSGGRVDGQRAHADEIWERLGYSKAIPAATPGLVTLTSGTNWLCAATGTYLVTCVGGGGGGGGGASTISASGTATGGGGGGSGGTSIGVLSLTAGTLYPYVVGAMAAGGNGGAAAGTNVGIVGGTGNNTTFGSGPLISAIGGGGGGPGATTNATTNIGGGLYAFPSTTTTNITAGNGGIANVSSFNLPFPGGGPLNGSGGAGAGGGNGGATNKGGTGGAAGTAIAGGAAGVTAGAGTAAGTAGGAAGVTAYGAGGGGGGGGNNSLAGGAGGAGAPGVIYIQKVG